jgi:hypothetical protein
MEAMLSAAPLGMPHDYHMSGPGKRSALISLVIPIALLIRSSQPKSFTPG